MINHGPFWRASLNQSTQRFRSQVVRSNNFIKNLTALREEHKLDFSFSQRCDRKRFFKEHKVVEPMNFFEEK